MLAFGLFDMNIDSAVSQKFCIRFWQFNMLPERYNGCQNSNIEIRPVLKASAANPKQYQNSNVQNSKQTKAV